MQKCPLSRHTATTESAPDGSKVTVLARGARASSCIAVLPAQSASRTVMHQTVEELWYVMRGHGEIFCQAINDGTPFQVEAGHSFVIPPQTAFQFRTTSSELEVLITTIPAWPGDEEGLVCEGGPWPPTVGG